MSGEQRTIFKGTTSQYVKLLVGGRLFYTTIGTLIKRSPSKLNAWFTGILEVTTNEEGCVLIDRCDKHFGSILNYLRDGSIPLPDSSQEIRSLLAEAKFYCLAGLIDDCERALKLRDQPKQISQVKLITSEQDEQMIVNSTTKPIIILAVQRLNNKHPYTAASDDNLLRNIEMFDKLSAIYSERILFIRDIIGTKEVCNWSFYGHGKKVGELNCARLINKEENITWTNVVFPEAKIYEETLMVLLCENRVFASVGEREPEQEIFEASSIGRDISSMAGNSSISSELDDSPFSSDDVEVEIEEEEADKNDDKESNDMIIA